MSSEDSIPAVRPPSHTRRHLIVFAFLVAAFALGSYLVVTGDDPVAKPPTSTVPSPPLRDLGTFPSQKAAAEALQHLDPTTLRLPATTVPGSSATSPTTSGPAPTSVTGPPTTDVRGTTVVPGTSPASGPLGDAAAPTNVSLKRCELPISRQTSDRQLGKLLAAGGIRIDRQWLIVTSYALPASGNEPAAVRTIVSDAVSCRIAFAINS